MAEGWQRRSTRRHRMNRRRRMGRCCRSTTDTITKDHQKTTKEEVSTNIRSASVRRTSPSHQHATQWRQTEKESAQGARLVVSRISSKERLKKLTETDKSSRTARARSKCCQLYGSSAEPSRCRHRLQCGCYSLQYCQLECAISAQYLLTIEVLLDGWAWLVGKVVGRVVVGFVRHIDGLGRLHIYLPQGGFSTALYQSREEPYPAGQVTNGS
ncbi:hypothetical protein KCU83_g3, partial [Aureobasidium melanogenum]